MLPYSSAFYSRTAPLHPVLILETQGLPQSLETTLKNAETRSILQQTWSLATCQSLGSRFPHVTFCAYGGPRTRHINAGATQWRETKLNKPPNQKIPTFNSSSSSPVIRCSKRLLSLLHRHASLEPIRTGWVVEKNKSLFSSSHSVDHMIASGRFSQNAWNKGNSPQIDPAPKEWPKTQSQFPICKSCDLQNENCWTVTCSFKIVAV